MAYPKKTDEERYIRQNITFNPETLNRMIKYCQEEERSMSWVVRKAVDKFLTEKGF